MKAYETIYEDLRTHVKPGKREIKMPWWGNIKMYPRTPEDLLKGYPDIRHRAYGEGPPVASKVKFDELQQLSSSLPMRGTHHLIQSKSLMKAVAAPWTPSPKALVAPDDDNLLTGPLL